MTLQESKILDLVSDGMTFKKIGWEFGKSAAEIAEIAIAALNAKMKEEKED